MTIDPIICLAIAAALGSLYYHLSGYLDAKKQNPDINYSYSHMLQTIFVMISVAGGYSAHNIEWSHYNLLLAFISGMGGTVAVSKFFRGIKNKLQVDPSFASENNG